MRFKSGSGWIYLALILPLQHTGASCGNNWHASAGFIGRRLSLYITCIDMNALLQKMGLLEVLGGGVEGQVQPIGTHESFPF